MASNLTPDEHALIARRHDSSLVRPQGQWREILADLAPHDAAARIFGDLMNYRSSIQRNGQRRDGYLGDVQQMANALEAWAMLIAERATRPPAVAALAEPRTAENRPAGVPIEAWLGDTHSRHF